jgi:hypothetical protein
MKKWSLWVKWGLWFALVDLVIMIFLLSTFDTYFMEPAPMLWTLGLFLNIPGFFVGQVVTNVFSSPSSYLTDTIPSGTGIFSVGGLAFILTGIIMYFLIGSVIGFVVQKIRHRNKS